MGDLRQSIQRGQLSLRFQPKVDLATRQVKHAEALLRWRHAELGAIPPDEFIPLAERSGFVHELTRFVLEQALGQNSRWRAQGLDLGVAINLSAMDLMDADLPDFIVGAHALLQCAALITRDAGFFRDYFKGLKIIVPKAS